MRKIITIDGTAWTGKSSVSRALAEIMGYQYINTGSMFRAIAYLLRKKNIHHTNTEAVTSLMKDTYLEFHQIGGESHLFVDKEDFTDIVADNKLVLLASQIASLKEVRATLVEIQRRTCKDGGFVIEGRDTGTVVFPDAEWKFFLKATIDTKINRFFKMLKENEKKNYTHEQVKTIVEETDRRDKEREIAPVKQAHDAIVYDNSQSPCAERDAAVLWYYITHFKEMDVNVSMLKSTKNP